MRGFYLVYFKLACVVTMFCYLSEIKWRQYLLTSLVIAVPIYNEFIKKIKLKWMRDSKLSPTTA